MADHNDLRMRLDSTNFYRKLKFLKNDIERSRGKIPFSIYADLLNRAEVDIRNMGISDSVGEMEVHSDNVMMSSEGKGEFSETVKFVTLDSLNLQPDFLKIDVEGYEMNVLKGALDTLRRCRPKLIIETHSSTSEKQVMNFLSREGYVLRHEHGRVVGLGWMDSIVNLFFSPS